MASDSNPTGNDRIGGYKLVRILLKGNTSAVYEVLDEASGKRYALKELNEGKVDDAAERKLFEFEARLGSELSHPNLIRVHQYVKSKDNPYFVMDYFPGEHLRVILSRRERADWLKQKLRRIIEQVAAALSYMHAKGWVHRDIKPENILVNKTSEVRLIDYAIAKRVNSGLGKLLAGKPPREGTLSYMSPEQILREPPAFASDIYSLGILCYELACGRPPFRANSPNELLNKHLREQPSPPIAHNRDITSEFSDLVMQMIRKQPQDRPASVREFLNRFNRIKIYHDDPSPDAAAF